MAVAALLGLAAGCTDDSDWASTRVSSSSTGLDASSVAELRDALSTVMADHDVPGAAVLVDLGAEGSWSAVAGTADLADGTPVTPDLEWPIRSITKSFTVTVLLQLVEEGRVSLDDTVDSWVPGIPEGDRVTLAQLADMTAGVPDYTGDAFIEDFVRDPARSFTTEDLIGYVRDGETVAPPGRDRIYINSSTVLLGAVIEQVTGRPVGEEIRARLLEPLGMEDTSYPTGPTDWPGPHAIGYQPGDAGPEPAPQNFTVFDAAGAMVSTPSDLAVWGEALAEGELVDDELQDRRLRGSPLLAGPEYDTYAMGMGEVAGWWGHTGEGFGFTALVMHRVGADATVAITMNLSDADRHAPTELFRRIVDVLGAGDD